MFFAERYKHIDKDTNFLSLNANIRRLIEEIIEEYNEGIENQYDLAFRHIPTTCVKVCEKYRKLKGYSRAYFDDDESFLSRLNSYELFVIIEMWYDELSIDGAESFEESINDALKKNKQPWRFKDGKMVRSQSYDENVKVQKISIRKLFLSYCHSDKCIAEIIDAKLNELTKERISITRDVRTMGYKDDIEKFMQTIEQHDFIITIISDKYLKSRGCMYEISELMRSRKYFDKLLFIVLSTNDMKYYDRTVKESDVKADIYSINRFGYIKYWESEKEKIDRIDTEIANIALKQGIVNEAKQVATISQNIAEFIEKLKNSMGKSLDEMLADDFKDFLSIVLF